jgi:uncharacterized protein YciI
VQFDQFTVVLLNLRPDAPVHSEEEADALQDAHLAHLSGLHEAGHMLAAGPFGHDTIRGMCIYRTDVEQTRAFCEQDPAVLAGRFSTTVIPWMVPSGVIAFPPASLPSSMEEVGSE